MFHRSSGKEVAESAIEMTSVKPSIQEFYSFFDGLKSGPIVRVLRWSRGSKVSP
jgi:hypothetical protein